MKFLNYIGILSCSGMAVVNLDYALKPDGSWFWFVGFVGWLYWVIKFGIAAASDAPKQRA